MAGRNSDVDSLIDLAWKEFRSWLADELDRSATEPAWQLEFSLPQPDDDLPLLGIDGDDRRITVSVARGRLARAGGLLPVDIARQVHALGFDVASDERPFLRAEVPANHPDQAAVVAVRCLRDLLDVIHPALLVANDGSWPLRSDAPRTESAHLPLPTTPSSRAQLDDLVEQTLRSGLGIEIVREDDGDIPLLRGTSIVYVRTSPHHPTVGLLSFMAMDVRDRPAALREVCELSSLFDGISFFVANDTVVATAEVLANPFVPDHLLFTLERMRDVVAANDTALARQVGGRTFGRLCRPSASMGVQQDLTSGENIHPVMLKLLELDGEQPGSLRPKLAARLCGYDRDLIRSLIQWNGEQEEAWREARDEALQTRNNEEASVCEHERSHAEHTVAVLRKALRRAKRKHGS